MKALKLANPASWITPEYLRRQAENPELTDAQVLQLHGCVWAASESTWIAPLEWAHCADRSREPVPGEPVVLGFDGSFSRDSTVLVACTLDGFLWPVRIWERPERAPAGWRVPRGEVDAAVDAAFESLAVIELACDPYGWAGEIEGWRGRHGPRVLDFPTASRQRMAPAVDRFRAAVLEHELAHDGDPVLAAHVGHAVARLTPYGHILGRRTRTRLAGSTAR